MVAKRFRQFNGAVLVVTLLVILWGAYVRASGSGNGCGSHWPSCNGEVIPRPRSVATLIEFTHRATSGLAFVLVMVQTWWAWRLFPRHHRGRRAAAASMALMVSEALVGAGLVLFEMVAQNRSVARGAWTLAHLTNTFALLAALALTGWFAGRPDTSAVPLPRDRSLRLSVRGALLGVLLVAASGGIAALGDTLFPVATWSEGWRQDLSVGAHLFVRLRVLHPVLALAVGIYVLSLAGFLASRDRFLGARQLATALAALVLGQMGAGMMNLALLAPLKLQLFHLLLADLVWLALVMVSAHLTWPATGDVLEPARVAAPLASIGEAAEP